METPLVSVIIPAYNAAPWLGETIDSVLAQKWTNIEIVIVDDGSVDLTLEVAKSYSVKNENIKVFTQSNKGAAAARNLALQNSTGKYIQFLDADDLLHFDKIASQVSLLENKPNAIAVGAWGIFVGDIGAVKMIDNGAFKKEIHPAYRWLIEAWTYGLWIPSFSWLVPQSVFKKAGYWNEALSLHDDGEYFCRVILNAEQILFEEKSIGYYRKGISNSLSSIINKKGALSHLEVCRLYEKHLLEKTNVESAQVAVIANYQNFIYFHYPHHRDLIKVAEADIKRLGGKRIEATGTSLFMFLKRFVGWKLARVIEKNYYGRGWNYASLKYKINHLYKFLKGIQHPEKSHPII